MVDMVETGPLETPGLGLRDWAYHPCLVARVPCMHKGSRGEEVAASRKEVARGCLLVSLSPDLICRIWSKVERKILAGMLTCKHIRSALFSVPRVLLRLERIPKNRQSAEAAVDFLHRFEGDVRLEVRLRDQLGPVLEPYGWLHEVAWSTTSLDLRGSDLDSHGAGFLAGLLASSGLSRLRKLELECNDLCEDGILQIAQVLPDLPSLSELSLGRTDMRDCGATHLAGSLPFCKSLTSLHLHSNFLGPGSARALADALPKCLQNVSTLNLSRNMLGPSGARLLASVLPQCKLREIDLSSNEIQGEGVLYISQALNDGFTTLRRLDLDNNCISRLKTSTLSLLCNGLLNSKDFQVFRSVLKPSTPLTPGPSLLYKLHLS